MGFKATGDGTGAGERPKRIPGWRFFPKTKDKQSWGFGNPNLLANASEMAKALAEAGHKAALRRFVVFGELADNVNAGLEKAEKLQAESTGEDDYQIRPGFREGESEIILRAMKVGRKIYRDAREGLEDLTLHVGATATVAGNEDNAPF